MPRLTILITINLENFVIVTSEIEVTLRQVKVTAICHVCLTAYLLNERYKT